MGFLSSLGKVVGIASGAEGLFSKSPSLNDQANVQYQWQRKLNQTAIQDRVKDAQKAGIHPLFALGASVQQGGISMPSEGSSMSERLSDMGQSIDRAATALDTRKQRAALEKSTMLDLEGKKLENDLLRTQIANSKISTIRQAGTPPPMQNVVVNPSEVEAARGKDPATVAGVPPSTQEFINRDGNISVMPSNQAKQAIEDDMLLQMEWYYRNKIIPFMREKRMFDPGVS